MKKTLAAVAVLGAFAGSAVAADVTLYGLVDLGLQYQHLDADKDGVAKTNSLKMSAGQNSGSRFGLKGVEDLGNGVKVGFVLENGFAADTGALSTSGKIFDREAQLYVASNFGTLSFGRVGQLASANGTYGLLGATGPFSTGYGDATAGLKWIAANGFARFDNTVTYATPTFGGLTVYAQYSFDNDSSADVKADKDGSAVHGVEGQSSVDRYYGIGAKFVAGGLTLVGTVDSINYRSYDVAGAKAHNSKLDDSITVTFGGNYDFEVAKVFFGATYFDNATKVGNKQVAQNADTKVVEFSKGYTLGSEGSEGWGLGLGVSAPVLGGTLGAYAGYLDAESVDNSDASLKRYVGAVGYSYNFSKRTSVYTTASYIKDKYVEKKDASSVKPSSVEVLVGMIHKF